MSKEDWKNTGTELGHAFKSFGKSFVKSAETVADKVTDEEKEEKSNAFKDGTWRKTSKEMGHAFKDLGKTIVRTAVHEEKSSEETTGKNDVEVESVKNSEEQ